MWEEPTRSDIDKRRVATPVVESEKVITEVSPVPNDPPTEETFEASLKEQFSSERFDRAMSTLERYRPEEGLRHLRENAPEIAKQIENSRHRNREEGAQ